MHQSGTPWADGTAYVTTCPQPPGAVVTYRFKLQANPGTYMYHEHASALRQDGLTGPLIIDPPLKDASPVQVEPTDGEFVLMLQGWMSQTADAVTAGLDKIPFELYPGPGSVLLNGVSFLRDCAAAADPAACAANGNTTAPRLSVSPGKKYRLRLINGDGLSVIAFAVQGHRLKVVAADGNPVQPVYVDQVFLHVGERYDVVLETKAAGQAGTYWVTAQAFDLPAEFSPTNITGHALLTYSGTPPTAVPAGR